jgi:hypothetical protein
MDAIHDTTTALLDLTESLTPEESTEGLLERVAARVLQLVRGADAITVTLSTDGRARTVSATDPVLVALDDVQYRAGDGPCLHALRTRTAVRADLELARHRWPAFADTATAFDVATVLSCPLFLPADDVIAHRQAHDRRLSGALNIWSTDPAAFDPVEVALTAMFTSAVSAVILTAARWAQARSHAEHLGNALHSRDVIATAKGIVMARRHLSAEEAFAWLADVSQNANVKLRDVAQLIIDDPDVVGATT